MHLCILSPVCWMVVYVSKISIVWVILNKWHIETRILQCHSWLEKYTWQQFTTSEYVTWECLRQDTGIVNVVNAVDVVIFMAVDGVVLVSVDAVILMTVDAFILMTDVDSWVGWWCRTDRVSTSKDIFHLVVLVCISILKIMV